MKKIVSILAVAALATSVFAADVSAQLKLSTNVYDSSKKAMFTTPASTGWDNNNTYIKLSGNLENAGATICLTQDSVKFKTPTAANLAETDESKITYVTVSDVKLYGYSLWFSPIENLKFTVGDNTVGTITKGTFAWWAQSVKFENVMGIKAEYTIGDLAVEFLSCNNALLDFTQEGADVLGNIWLAGTYGLGDWGTVQGFFAKGATINAYGVGGWMSGYWVIGAAWNNMPWQQTGYYADAFVALNKDFSFQEVGGQFGGQYVANGLALRMTNMVAYGHKYGAPDATFDYGFAAQASYAIDAYTPYVKLIGNEILAKDGAGDYAGKLTVEVGVDATFGGCAINAAINAPLSFAKGSEFNFAIPVSFAVAF